MRKVLVVDDDLDFAHELGEALGAVGFTVLTANDADSASLIALRERPDLILLELDMPHYTGLELHQALQFSERGQRIPVVFLVDELDPDYQQMAMKQGAKAVVSKLYDLGRLVATVRSVLCQPSTPPEVCCESHPQSEPIRQE